MKPDRFIDVQHLSC